MNIKPITTSIKNATNAAIDYANKATNKFMECKTGHTWMPENPTDIAKTLALYSTTTKDAVNCYYYTTQSYNNKEIPEDKRKFVAGIDLANGILNVISVLMFGILCIFNWLSSPYIRYKRRFRFFNPTCGWEWTVSLLDSATGLSSEKLGIVSKPTPSSATVMDKKFSDFFIVISNVPSEGFGSRP